MNKLVYCIRHAGSFVKINQGKTPTFFEQNVDMILSVDAEEKARKMSEAKQLQNIDSVYCSNSVRAIQTAKYIAYKNGNMEVNVENALNERCFGVKYIKELPCDYIKRQYDDFDYKLENGESINEVKERITRFIDENILVKNFSKVAVVLHGVNLTAYLTNFCKVSFLNDQFKILFNNDLVYDGILKSPDIFELEFDYNNKIQSVKNIKIGE